MRVRAGSVVAVCLVATTGCADLGPTARVAAPPTLPPVCAELTASAASQVLGSRVEELLTTDSSERWSCFGASGGLSVAVSTTPYDDVVARAWSSASPGEVEPVEVVLPGADAAVQLDQGDGVARHLVTIASARGLSWEVRVSAATRDEEARLAEAVWTATRGESVETREPGPAPSVCRRVGLDRVAAALGRPVRVLPRTSDPDNETSCSLTDQTVPGFRGGRSVVTAGGVGPWRIDGYADVTARGGGGEVVELPGDRPAYYVAVDGDGGYLGVADTHGGLGIHIDTGDPAEDERVARALAAG